MVIQMVQAYYIMTRQKACVLQQLVHSQYSNTFTDELHCLFDKTIINSELSEILKIIMYSF